MNEEFYDWLRALYGTDGLEGCGGGEIDSVRELFGAIPRTVEDFWRKAVKTPALHRAQDVWILPENIPKREWLKGSDCLILLNENQGVYRAGVRREDLTLEDPPVYLTEDDKTWKLCADSVTEFLYSMLAYEAVFSYEYCPEEFYRITEKEIAVLERQMTRLPYKTRGWFGDGILLLSNRPDNMIEIIDCGDGDFQMLFGAASESSYLALMDVVEGMGEPL